MFNNTYERASFTSPMANCKIDGDNIFQCDYMGNPQSQIGKTVSSYKKLKDVCDKQNEKLEEYYNRLVEAGLEQPKQTPEEVAKQSTELMQKMLETMNKMQNQIDNLEKDKDVRPRKSDTNSSENDGTKQPTNIGAKRSC